MDKTQPNKLNFPYQMQNDSNGVVESLFKNFFIFTFQHTTIYKANEGKKKKQIKVTLHIAYKENPLYYAKPRS